MDAYHAFEGEAGRALLVSMITSSDDAVVGSDLDNIITYWNMGAERLFGYSAEEALGQSITLIAPGDGLTEVQISFSRSPSGESVSHYEALRCTKDGRVVDVAIRVWILRDAKGQHSGTLRQMRDMSHRRVVEQLQESDRSKSEFLAIVAHELRNPMVPLLACAAMLRTLPREPSELARIADSIERHIRQLSRLVEDLTDLGRIIAGKLEVRCRQVEVTTAMDMAIESSRPLIDQMQQSLQILRPARPTTVNADMDRLVQVFTNLLNNAAKFTPEQGIIQISIDVDDGSVITTIRDSGMGIAPEKLLSVFGLFSQGKRCDRKAHNGLGIGLAIARSIIEAHGGTICASSAGLGHGTAVSVRLPLAVRDAVSDQATVRQEVQDVLP